MLTPTLDPSHDGFTTTGQPIRSAAARAAVSPSDSGITANGAVGTSRAANSRLLSALSIARALAPASDPV